MSEEMIDDVPSARRLAEEFMAGYTPGRDAPWIVEEAFAWLQERSIEPIAAYNPNERLSRAESLLKQALEAIGSARSEPLFIMRDAIRNFIEGEK